MRLVWLLVAVTAYFGLSVMADKESSGGYDKQNARYRGSSSLDTGGSTNGQFNEKKNSVYTSNRRRGGRQGGSAGRRGTKMSVRERGGSGSTSIRGGGNMRSRRWRRVKYRDVEKMSGSEKQKMANELKTGQFRSTDGRSVGLSNNYKGGNPRYRLRGRQGGRRRNAKAYGSGCKGDGNAKNCQDLNFDEGGGDEIKMTGKDGKKDEENGIIRRRTRGRNGKMYYYKVNCEEGRNNEECGSSKSYLKMPNGEVLECTPEKKGDVTVTKCCKNGRRCVTSNQDADGTVYVGRNNVRTAKTKCKSSGKYQRIKGKKFYEKYECGADSTGNLNSNAQNTQFSESKSCSKDDLPPGKEIKVKNAKYQPVEEKSGGFTNFNFPDCGTMSADIEFIGFSNSELKELGPKLAYQMIVNVSPAGQLSCVDNAACLTNRKGDAKEDNCYYCSLCDVERHKGGILDREHADLDEPCQEMSRKTRLSVRICPFNEENKQTMCHAMKKNLQSTYATKKGDIDVKLVMYIREKTQDDVERQYAAMQTGLGKITWKFLKPGYVKAEQLRDGDFSKKSAAEQDFLAYKAYMRDSADKGSVLSCHKFSTDYNLFGDNLTEVTDVLTAARDLKGLYKSRECAAVTNKRMETYQRKHGG